MTLFDDSEERLYDELAGVVDLFGALTRSELERALSELAFKQGGQSADAEALSAAVDDAVDRYYLVECDPEADAALLGESELEAGEALLAVGPVAFPALPPNAEDLPHILDVEPRDIDRESLGERLRRRFRDETARAIDVDDRERAERLLDVSYDLEAWAPVDVSAERDELAAALEDAAD